MSNIVDLDKIIVDLEARHGPRIYAEYLQDRTYQTFEDGVTCLIKDDGTVAEGVKPLPKSRF